MHQKCSQLWSSSAPWWWVAVKKPMSALLQLYIFFIFSPWMGMCVGVCSCSLSLWEKPELTGGERCHQWVSSVEAGGPTREQPSWWFRGSTLGQRVDLPPPPGQNSQPDGESPRACVVAPCVTLSCAGLCDPQEEDSAPPRPPLPQSYEPVPPTVPPLPSRASIRPSSLYRPEDRKVSSRNGTASVSSLTR